MQVRSTLTNWYQCRCPQFTCKIQSRTRPSVKRISSSQGLLVFGPTIPACQILSSDVRNIMVLYVSLIDLPLSILLDVDQYLGGHTTSQQSYYQFKKISVQNNNQGNYVNEYWSNIKADVIVPLGKYLSCHHPKIWIMMVARRSGVRSVVLQGVTKPYGNVFDVGAGIIGD